MAEFQNPFKKLTPNKDTHFKKIIAVISGKGGVGKSLVTSLLAAQLAKKGNKVAIIDADVTGPSIPQSFGLQNVMADSNGTVIFPVETELGIKVMSTNLLLEDDEAPVVWRGPLVASFVQQLFTDVQYGDIDYLVVDMPPGTGDIPLTVFQVMPVDEIVVVSSPQELVSMVVAKSINMAKMMHIEIAGLVENMAFIECPDCCKKITVFGNGDYSKEVEKSGLEVIAEIPIDPRLAAMVDAGRIEDYETDVLDKLIEKVSIKS